MEDDSQQEELHVANRNSNFSNINERLQRDENRNRLLSIEEDNLLELKKELGLIDADGNDFYTRFSPSMTDDSVFAVNAASDTDSGCTPFDLPLTEQERILLEQCTIGSPVSFSAREDRSSIRSSQSLDQITDILIRDLEGFEVSTSRECRVQCEGIKSRLHQEDSIETRKENSTHNFESDMVNRNLSPDKNSLEKACINPYEGTPNKFKQTENDPNTSRTESGALQVDSPSDSAPQTEVPDVKKVNELSYCSSNSNSSSRLSRSSSLGLESVASSTDSGLAVKEAEVARHRYFVVVAIDFGTTFSGYAFAFTRDYGSIHMMRRWEGGDPGVSNQKTPTTLLLKPDGTFHSFGFGARDFYHDLEPAEAKKWLYFEKFKMSLHTDKDIHKSVEIKAANGKSLKAVTVFAHALRFFKDHVLEELSDQSATAILEEDIQWVLTVPAIWRAPAKQFMRNAAYEAGLATADNPDRLLIALEPEAAAIYCRKIRLRDCVWGQEAKKRSNSSLSSTESQVVDEFSGKTKYVVVDCGGGTVDLTVHQMDTNTGGLVELHKATGGACGATGVDQEFEKLLKKIFGKDFIEQFKLKRSAGWVDLMIAFEARKRTAAPNKTNPLNISLPFSFIEYYKKHRGSSIESAVKKHGNPNVKWSSQGMLRISPELMKELFQPVLSNIIDHVATLINKPAVHGVQFLFLVGGFAESPLLQAAVREVFGSKLKVIIPQDVSLTILKGAVLFGIDPTVVRIRRAAVTYGVGVLNRFVPGKHPREKYIRKSSIEWCTDIFDKFVTVDQSVSLGEKVTRSYAPAKTGQKYIVINIFSTENSDVIYVTDAGVTKCGCLKIKLPDVKDSDPRKPRELQACMTFADTEIKVSAIDVASGKEVKASIDFLKD